VQGPSQKLKRKISNLIGLTILVYIAPPQAAAFCLLKSTPLGCSTPRRRAGAMYRVSLLTIRCKRMPDYWPVDPGGEDRYQQLAKCSRQPTKPARRRGLPHHISTKPKNMRSGLLLNFRGGAFGEEALRKSQRKQIRRAAPSCVLSKLVWSPDGCPTPEQEQ
jgi:hypothetical protein